MPYVERRTADGKVDRYYTRRTNAKRKPARETGRGATHTQSK